MVYYKRSKKTKEWVLTTIRLLILDIHSNLCTINFMDKTVEAEIFPFYATWFGLGLPVFLVMALFGSETRFALERIIHIFALVMLILSSLAYLHSNKKVAERELLKGFGDILLVGIFLGPTPVIIYLFYTLLF